MSQFISAQRTRHGVTRLDMNEYYDDIEIEKLYQWIDRIPLTRPKKNVSKDFSDGVLVAEMIKHYFPRMVDLHNYTPAHAAKQKMENWYLLNKKVLRRLDLDLSDDVIRALTNCQGQVVEKVLLMLRNQIDRALERQESLKLRAKQLQETLTKAATSPSPVQDYPRTRYPRSPQRSLPNMYPQSPQGSIPHGHPARMAYSTGRSVLQPHLEQVSMSLMEDKELESLAKDETIRILQAKLKRLEHLLQLKELRVEDLEARLDAATAASPLRMMHLDHQYR